MNIENDITLLLTASVDPKGMLAAATVPDPFSREADYLRALDFYLREHPRIRKIVFSENSNWPLGKFEKLFQMHSKSGKRFECLSFNLNDFPRSLGKSYGEMLLLDHALAASELVKGARYIAKITGRTILANLTAMLEHAPAPLDFYADLRDHPLYEWAHLPRCGRHGESRFYITTVDFYDRHFRGRYAQLNDTGGMMVETLIYNVVKQTLKKEKVTARFRTEPDFRGLAGHLGKDYGSLREKAKRLIRGVLRQAAPWLRI